MIIKYKVYSQQSQYIYIYRCGPFFARFFQCYLCSFSDTVSPYSWGVAWGSGQGPVRRFGAPWSKGPRMRLARAGIAMH